MILRRRHEVAKRVHRIRGSPLGSHVAQRIARTSSDNAEVCVQNSMPGLKTPPTASAFDPENTGLFQLRAGILGAIEQHAIEIHPRIDEQRLTEVHLDFA